MKRFALCMLALMLIFSGCAQSKEDPFKVDTVVQIPVDPTDAPTETPTEPETMPTEASAETEAATEPKETTAKTTASSYKSSSSKTSSSSKKQTAATQPPATEPPETVPPETAAPTEAPTEPPYDPSSYSIGGLEYAILEELNAYRAEAEVGELSLSGYLSGIAYIRAEEVSISWSHTRPDGRGFTSALSDYGFGYGSASENLIYVAGSGDAAAIVAKWMSAGSNSADILSDGFTKVGIGVYSAGGVTYVACILVG